jgi:hypothetical protein
MSVCIGICVYKNEFGLPFVFKNIQRIQSLFTEKKIEIIVAYDESPDASLGFLISKLKTFNIHILKNTSSTKIKVDNISNARNNILHYIRETFPETTYMIMMDSNEYACIGDISLDILKETFEREKEWDAISFDREAGYYDHRALSFDPFIYSFFHTMDYTNTVVIMSECVGKLLENAKKTPDILIPVFSAFNGFSIYKWSVFKDCNYKTEIDISLFPREILEKQMNITGISTMNRFNKDCEHLHFHLQAIRDKNARIRILPKSLFSIFKGEKMKECRGPC